MNHPPSGLPFPSSPPEGVCGTIGRGKAPVRGGQSIKYPAVIFDLFGTLVDSFSHAGYEAVHAKVASTVGVPFDDFARLWLETTFERNAGE